MRMGNRPREHSTNGGVVTRGEHFVEAVAKEQNRVCGQRREVKHLCTHRITQGCDDEDYSNGNSEGDSEPRRQGSDVGRQAHLQD
jgi:hypothetical protein